MLGALRSLLGKLQLGQLFGVTVIPEPEPKERLAVGNGSYQRRLVAGDAVACSVLPVGSGSAQSVLSVGHGSVE